MNDLLCKPLKIEDAVKLLGPGVAHEGHATPTQNPFKGGQSNVAWEEGGGVGCS